MGAFIHIFHTAILAIFPQTNLQASEKSLSLQKISFEQENTLNPMEELKPRILKDGSAKAEGGIVRVNSFLNHQLDPQLMMHCAEEFACLFKDQEHYGIGVSI